MKTLLVAACTIGLMLGAAVEPAEARKVPSLKDATAGVKRDFEYFCIPGRTPHGQPTGVSYVNRCSVSGRHCRRVRSQFGGFLTCSHPR
jgi:hypothetical protein